MMVVMVLLPVNGAFESLCSSCLGRFQFVASAVQCMCMLHIPPNFQLFTLE